MASISIMEEIQRLIAPPGECSPTKSGLDLHPYFKRPGKGHNNDRCDSCGESGNLLCCDQCPASFHLVCHDPPISVETLPEGDWLCHKCKATEALTLGASPVILPFKNETDEDLSQEAKSVRTPLEFLLQAASLLNPKQFDLPPELRSYEILPEDDKVTTEPPSKKKLCENVNRLADASAIKLCHSCRKSSRSGLLLACDFCSAHFHLDCLDPPLSTPPISTVWMCPLHVENLIDTKLLPSSRLSERVRLCERFCGPVDQESIKCQFLRRTRSRAARYRSKIPVDGANLVEVPDGVRSLYESRPSLLTPANEIDLVCTGEDEPAHEDRDLWLTSVVNLHLNTACERLLSEIIDQKHVNTVSLETPNRDSNGVLDRSTSGLPHITDHSLSNGDVDECPPSSLSAYLHRQLQMLGRPHLDLLPSQLVHLLAAERLHQLLGSGAGPLLAPPAALDSSLCWGSLVAPRAVLAPLQGPGSAVALRYRSVSVGLGAGFDVDLSSHGHCNYLHEQHAVIVLDDSRGNFELLAYGSGRCTVDGLLYGVSLTRTPRAIPLPGVSAPPPSPDSMSARSIVGARTCRCRAGLEGPPALESPAPLLHGSLLSFGCLRFVFGSNLEEGGSVLEALSSRKLDSQV